MEIHEAAAATQKPDLFSAKLQPKRRAQQLARQKNLGLSDSSGDPSGSPSDNPIKDPSPFPTSKTSNVTS